MVNSSTCGRPRFEERLVRRRDGQWSHVSRIVVALYRHQFEVDRLNAGGTPIGPAGRELSADQGLLVTCSVKEYTAYTRSQTQRVDMERNLKTQGYPNPRRRARGNRPTSRASVYIEASCLVDI